MSGLLSLVQEQLLGAGYAVATADDKDGPIVLFENDSILGFVLCFPSVSALLHRWRPTSHRVLQTAQLALRRAGPKAWNAYLVLLTAEAGNYGENTMLGAIEENLVGTRKIANAGIADADDVQAALLPLITIQNAPRLDAVDMSTEIRLRTSELPSELVDAFLSAASEAALAQLFEASQ